MRFFLLIWSVLLVLTGSAMSAFAASPHATLTWKGPGTCLACHTNKANEVFGSVHYQWKGASPEIVNHATGDGKFAAMNAYCVNPLGNWDGCNGCHVGRGVMPSATVSTAQLENIDCLVCHQPLYKRAKVNGIFQPDTAKMTITMDQAVQTVGKTTRETCLQCHAKAGGGDALKRGDLALAHSKTADRNYDVHMATTGANLACTACHRTQAHKIAGRGSDLRPSEGANPIYCSTTTCHSGKTNVVSGHSSEQVSKHAGRVACQTCHIPIYARNAADTVASELTETHRTWTETEFANNRQEPFKTLGGDLKPVYRFWNRKSWGYDLKDVPVKDSKTGNYILSIPQGGINDAQSKLYPFKFKTAEQPLNTLRNTLIALDTKVFFATGNLYEAVQSGLVNMGYSKGEPYSIVKTQEHQLLNHEVSPKAQALNCSACHTSGTAKQMNLLELGYGLKAAKVTICAQCHGPKESMDFYKLHEKHVKDKKVDCSMCHTFSRPELGLRVGIQR